MDRSYIDLDPVTQMRVDAEIAFNGPSSLGWGHESERYWGSLVLQLGKRQYRADYNETISVYANLFNNSQQFGVVRLVTWHGQNARKQFRSNPQAFQLTLNAKFVEVPKEWVVEWVNRFPSISTIIGDHRRDIDPEIRRLKLVLYNVSASFEKAWINWSQHDPLNEAWEETWGKIMSVSTAMPNLDNFSEYFTYWNPNAVYENGTL